MQEAIDALIQIGPAGMFVAAFLAGSILPFSSELVMLGLIEAGSDPVSLVIWGSVGNTLGGMVNYFIGSCGRKEWITRFAKVAPEKLERGKRQVRRYGAWAGLLAWIPIVGEVFTVAMGYMRTNLLLSIATIAAGKYARYQIIVSTWLAARA